MRFEDFDPIDEITPDGQASLEDLYIEQETKQALWPAINNLPDTDRDILLRIVVNGQSQAEVARIYGTQQPAIAKRLKRILAHLKQEISADLAE
jgi:RNA polymerase sigma factor (sigma-70 family)